MNSLNQVYGWGTTSNGAIGVRVFGSQSYPTQISFQGRRITKIACGAEHSVFLTEQHDVLGLGDGEAGQLGLGYNTILEHKPI